MKVVITGHKKGIGKSIYNYFLLKNYEVIGFSKSDGFDISEEKIRTIIYEECLDSSIFVNNAYNDNDDSQLLLLTHVSKMWKKTNNIIINISSRYTNENSIYGNRKKELDEFCKKNENLNIINLKPSLTDTQRVKHHVDRPKMHCDDVVNILDFCLNSNLKIEEVKFKCKQIF